MDTNELLNIKMLSPLNLAYIGDCVFELLARSKSIANGNMPVSKLHKLTVSHVCAASQSKGYEAIKDMLTSDEEAIYKRGRNAHGSHVPKNANPQDYRRATGIEALFGYLYLTKQEARISELFDIMYQSV